MALTETTTTVCSSIELELEPAPAFDLVVEELAAALQRSGIQFEGGAKGRVLQSGVEVARVVSWNPGHNIRLEWRPADWDPRQTCIELRFEPAGERTKVTIEHSGWGGLIGAPDELAGWFAAQVAAPFLAAAAPAALGDWLTDRGARRPSGQQARAIYRDPLFHYPNFRVILAELALGKDDYLLEVGCGGGALLRDALRSGCRAAAVDHSPEMVRLARETNRGAIADRRLEILEAKADQLPFPDAVFTCAAMTGVLGFLADPVAALSEIRRALRPGGRLVALGSDPELKGTPAAPEPMASRLRFYNERDLEGLARKAGFDEVRVIQRNLLAFAREVGVPEGALSLFDGPARFLLAQKR
ncbi:MAG: methyltransferase domain-containing protein [Acidobacteriota bacterium]